MTRAIVNLSSPARHWASDFVVIPLLLANAVSGAFVSPVAVVGIGNEYGLGHAAAGGVLTTELVFSALASIFIARHLKGLDLKRAALLASTACIVLQAISAVDVSFSVFLAIRALVGIASGVLYAVACYLAAHHPNGVRIMSVGFIFSSIAYGIGLAVWPSTVQTMGLTPFYLSLAAFSVPAVILLQFHAPIKAKDAEQASILQVSIPFKPFAFLLVICALGNGGLQMLWTFSEGVAISRSFGIDDIELVLSTSAVFNIVGALLSSYLDWKFGVSIPLFIGLTVGVGAGIVLGVSQHFIGYTLGIYLYALSAFFVLPYMLSAGAAFDESGHAATIAGGTVYMASAIGPVMGGLIADYVGVTAVGLISALAIATAGFFALLLKRAVHV